MILRDWYSIFAAQYWLRIKYFRLERRISGCDNLDDFFAVLSKRPSDRFLFYEKLGAVKYDAIGSIFDHLQINPKGFAVMDIGPGHGEFLDRCEQGGASSLHFIELDPVFYIFNKLKGYQGRRCNHLFALDKLPGEFFDLIWASGPVNADNFVSSKFGIAVLKRWLRQLDRILRPSGHVFIKPAFRNNGMKRALGDATDNPFARVMFENDYKCLPSFEGHNHEPGYPVTFYKKKATPS